MQQALPGNLKRFSGPLRSRLELAKWHRPFIEYSSILLIANLNVDLQIRLSSEAHRACRLGHLITTLSRSMSSIPRQKKVFSSKSAPSTSQPNQQLPLRPSPPESQSHSPLQQQQPWHGLTGLTTHGQYSAQDFAEGVFPHSRHRHHFPDMVIPFP
jgi:hypothetical protein